METVQTVVDRRREMRARRSLQRQGYVLRKSRSRTWSLDNWGGYMIIEPFLNVPVAGCRFEFNLDDVEYWLAN